MNTITFATTQMNLINCIEYVSTIEGNHCLVVDSASRARKKQMQSLLKIPAYAYVYDKILFRSNRDSRLFDFFNTLIYHIKLFIISKIKHFDLVVSGNYLCFGSRLFCSFLSKSASYIACDDGTGTITVAKERVEEVTMKRPMMYIPNRFIKKVITVNPQRFIPNQITFFTNYQIEPNGRDSIIKHNYSYLKEHLSEFNVDTDIFNCETIVLGEPLYFKGFVTRECYVRKLIMYAQTAKVPILYYAHPEETFAKWAVLKLQEQYKYVDNFLPFEIIAALLPDNCRVATFISSVLMNIKVVNSKVIPECISFKKDEVLPPFNYDNVLSLYHHYERIGVKFYEFD